MKRDFYDNQFLSLVAAIADCVACCRPMCNIAIVARTRTTAAIGEGPQSEAAVLPPAAFRQTGPVVLSDFRRNRRTAGPAGPAAKVGQRRRFRRARGRSCRGNLPRRQNLATLRGQIPLPPNFDAEDQIHQLPAKHPQPHYRLDDEVWPPRSRKSPWAPSTALADQEGHPVDQFDLVVARGRFSRRTEPTQSTRLSISGVIRVIWAALL